MGSSLSSPKYDVFLSFRGEDTGDNFSSHLYAALSRKKIKTYADDSPKGGDEISPALIKTIKKSKICVIIFSENYASSSSCLDELVQIMKYKERSGMIVLPVFYGVDPSHVRKQQESYAIKNSNGKDKVQAWKTALNKAASLSGWDSQNVRPESKLIGEIVKDVQKKLDHIHRQAEMTSDVQKKLDHIHRQAEMTSAPAVARFAGTACAAGAFGGGVGLHMSSFGQF